MLFNNSLEKHNTTNTNNNLYAEKSELLIHDATSNHKDINGYFGFVITYTYVPIANEKAYANVKEVSSGKTAIVELENEGQNQTISIDNRYPSTKEFEFFPGSEFEVFLSTTNPSSGDEILTEKLSVKLLGNLATVEINYFALDPSNIIMDYTYISEDLGSNTPSGEEAFAIIENIDTKQKSTEIKLEDGENKKIYFNKNNAPNVSFIHGDEFRIDIYTKNSYAGKVFEKSKNVVFSVSCPEEPTNPLNPTLTIDNIDFETDGYFSFITYYTYILGNNPTGNEKAYLYVTDLSFETPKTKSVELSSQSNYVIVDEQTFPGLNFVPGNEFEIFASIINSSNGDFTTSKNIVKLKGGPATIKINSLAVNTEKIFMNYTYIPEEPLYDEVGYAKIINLTSQEEVDRIKLENGNDLTMTFDKQMVNEISFNPGDLFEITLYTENSYIKDLNQTKKTQLANKGEDPLEEISPDTTSPSLTIDKVINSSSSRNNNSNYSFTVTYTYISGNPIGNEKAYLYVTDLSSKQSKTETILLSSGEEKSLIVDENLFPSFNFSSGSEFEMFASTINAEAKDVQTSMKSITLKNVAPSPSPNKDINLIFLMLSYWTIIGSVIIASGCLIWMFIRLVF